MACGLPVISTDCESGPAEILGGGAYGVLTPVGDEQKLAEAMMAMLDEDNRVSFRQKSLERAEAFDVSMIAEKYLAELMPVARPA
jgi:glycosyltransferase involved in cell wall biosynthesis